jgi:hypothetical protein
MSQRNFNNLVAVLFIASVILTWFFYGGNDKLGFAVTTLGSLATCATLYIAFKIFKSFNSTATVEKIQFDLVVELVDYIISQRVLINAPSLMMSVNMSKIDLDIGLDTIKRRGLTSSLALFPWEFMEINLKVHSKLNYYFFPKDLREEVQTIWPRYYSMQQVGDTDGFVKLTFGNKFPDFFGHCNDKEITLGEFLDLMRRLKLALEKYLNDRIDNTYHVRL